MASLFSSLRRNQRLLKDLVLRDLKARYVGSSMGFFWSVVFPIVNLVVYMFVFRLVLKTRWSDQQGTAEVALLMLAGIIVWQAFAESVSRMTNTLVDNSNLIQKVVFPAEVLPLYLTISSLINMFIGLVITVLGVVFFAYVKPEAKVVVEQPPVSSAQELEDREALASFRVLVATALADRVVAPSERALLDQRYAATRLPPNLTVDSVLQEKPNADSQLSWITQAATRSRLHAQVVEMLDADGQRSRAERNFLFGIEGHRMGLGLSIVCLPLLFVMQITLMLGLGYFLATFNLFLRDTYHLIGVFLTVWMFATPIFYPAKQVEDGGYGWILSANPMHWLIDSYRSVLIYGTWPDWGMLGCLVLVASAVLLAGSSFFMTQKPRFPDLL